MKKIAILITTLGAALALTTGVAFADPDNCKPIYGGGETCVQARNFTIDKRIQNPTTQQFVDNLGVNDPKFTPGATVNFAITVTNTSDRPIQNMTVTDTFAKFVEFASGQGQYDKAKRVLTFSVPSLEPDEEKTYIVKARVLAAQALPANQNVNCMANLAQAKVGNTTGADNAQFCIQKTGDTTAPTTAPNNGRAQPVQPTQAPTTKGGLPVMPEPKSNQSPATGPEALSLLALLPSGIAGFLLRRKITRS